MDLSDQIIQFIRLNRKVSAGQILKETGKPRSTVFTMTSRIVTNRAIVTMAATTICLILSCSRSRSEALLRRTPKKALATVRNMRKGLLLISTSLALMRPFAMRVVEKLVDRLLAGDDAPHM